MGDENIDINEKLDWLNEVLTKKKEEKPKKVCPYCKKEFAQLARHIINCPEKPKDTPENVMTKNKKLDVQVRELKIQLDEYKDTIRDLADKVKDLTHFELTEENIISYFRTVKYAKKYELYRSFFPHNTREIDKIIEKLYKEGTLRRNQNYWYSLNPKFKKKEEK